MLKSFDLTDYSLNSTAFIDPEEVIHLEPFVPAVIPETRRIVLLNVSTFNFNNI